MGTDTSTLNEQPAGYRPRIFQPYKEEYRVRDLVQVASKGYGQPHTDAEETWEIITDNFDEEQIKCFLKAAGVTKGFFHLNYYNRVKHLGASFALTPYYWLQSAYFGWKLYIVKPFCD